MTCPTLPRHPFPEQPERTDFDTEQLGLGWNHIQLPETDGYSLTERKGFLRLKGASETVGSRNPSTFLGQRLRHHYFTATTRLDFDPAGEKEEAGMILFNNGSHFDILVHEINGQRFLVVRLQFGRTVYESQHTALQPGPVDLRIKGEKTTFTFSYSQDGKEFRDIETVDAKFIATETVGWFTGVYVGLYATGNGEVSKSPADYDWFEYVVGEVPESEPM
jgi:alpha-N-arabinofuranosidase